MAIQINYKNKNHYKTASNLILFVGEKFDIKGIKKLISDTEGNLQSIEKSAVGEFHKDFKKAKTMGKQLEKELEKKGKQGVKVLKTSVDVSKKRKKVEGFTGF